MVDCLKSPIFAKIQLIYIFNNRIIMTSVLLQSSFYKFGDALGAYSSIALVIVFVLIWVWVMFKYLDTSDLNG